MAHPNQCETFETLTTPDLGQCSPYRLKLDCDAINTTVPVSSDPNAFLEPDLEATPPYRLVGSILDEVNGVITDENNDPILGPTL
jgi:hypothetical protein